MTVASVTATSAQVFLDRGSELTRQLRALQIALIHEAEALPGTTLAYGRPHEHARRRNLPRWSRTGVRVAGVNVVRPDCPRPIRGRCECPPDGSWRPIGGAIRADSSAIHAELVRNPDNRDETMWADAVYVEGPDGLWRCIRPTRRALERMRGESLRKYLALERLLEGMTADAAWRGLGQPEDAVVASLDALRLVERWSIEEAAAEYEKRPRRWRSLPWTELSESQQAAVIAAEEVVAS